MYLRSLKLLQHKNGKKLKKKWRMINIQGLKGMSLNEFKKFTKFMTADIEDKKGVVDDIIWPLIFLEKH